MAKDNFNTIFSNPYMSQAGLKEEPESDTQPVEANPAKVKVKNKNDTIFYTKIKKEKKMIYIKVTSSQKLEKIAKKYKLSSSEVLDLMIENQEY